MSAAQQEQDRQALPADVARCKGRVVDRTVNTTTRRHPRTAGEAFKDAGYATAFHGPEPLAPNVWDVLLVVLALVVCIGAFVLYHGPSELEAARDTAASVGDSVAQAVASAQARSK